VDGQTRTLTASFEVTDWSDEVYDEPAEGPAMGTATVAKRFTGVLEGTSVARLLTAGGPGGRGYVASERIEGVLDGRRGSFVVQHGGLDAGGDLRTFGHVVPGSGTGELAGLAGEVRFRHDESGAAVTFVLTS